MKVVLWFYEQDVPADEVSCVFFSVKHGTEKNEMHDFSNIAFLGSVIFLRQGNIVEHDHIFVFVYANSLFRLSSGM